ncbi:hypothetical protein COLO4_38507 [Corchorus olitorius]|uniref:Uncharacterized protein n=1 Tax=Corchorus olitorius TaxID=93759 RepID=A0A1R3FUJ9_9ROSI|nr:hypothetical protein COLO4_38507 [Corchorus olitorius]
MEPTIRWSMGIMRKLSFSLRFKEKEQEQEQK